MLFVVSWQSFGMAGKSGSSGWSYIRNPNKRVRRWPENDALQLVAQRWRSVAIECDDAMRVIRRFDGPRTLHYLDPPYVASTLAGQHRYEIHTTDDQHLTLLKQAKQLKGMVILSGYRNRMYDRELKRWHRVDLKSVDVKAKPRVESLWLNPRAYRENNGRTRNSGSG